jgi:TolB-like protein/DNA-binding winged helix-turn-helix (wHTH) protein/Tfp pilus assembly protein PilF
MTANRSYSFGEYTLDLARGALLKSGAGVRLRPKAFEVLRLLIEQHGRLVTKDELLHEVWGHTVVTEASVVQCLIDIRRAIGDESQQTIKTVPRRGYIFDVPVVVSDDPTQEGGANVRPSAQPRVESPIRSLRQRLLAAVLISLVPVLIWWGLASRGTDAVRPVERGPQAPHNSIAVLPFANMSGDPDSDYFCDGISEEILNRLASFPDLHVIARTSSFALKDSGFDAPKLASLLGVRYLLQGSVRREGEQVRIAAQLVDGSGVQVWSDTYDRELRGIFAIQQEIADAVATHVVPKLVRSPRIRSEAEPNLDAYQHYLVGREILYKRQPHFWELAEKHLRQATAIDPQYAEAHAELGILWALTAGWQTDPHRMGQLAERAQEAIDRALALKPELARAFAAQGLLLQQRYPPDYPGSEKALRKALTLDPNMVDVSNWLASVLAAQWQRTEGLAVLERAARIDPLASPLMGNLAGDYAARGDPARAEQILRRLLELPQPSYYVYWELADQYFCAGRLVEAHEMAKRLVLSQAGSPDPANWYGLLALSYARLGLWESADYWLKRQERERRDELNWPGLNRPELLRLQGRYKEMAKAIQDSPPAGGGIAAPGPALEYGILQALAGDYRGAIGTLASYVDIETSEEIDHYGARHALAWAYLNTGETERAHRLLHEFDRRYRDLQAEGWLHVSEDLARFAQNAALAGDKELAIGRLRQAVEAGWRGYYSASNDPRWQSLRDDPRFNALMATVKADIEAQRVQVEQIETKDDFVARLEKASENRR